MDLSFPQGRAVNSSINKNHYLGTEVVLTLPSIDNITEKVKNLPKAPFSIKLILNGLKRCKLEIPSKL